VLELSYVGNRSLSYFILRLDYVQRERQKKTTRSHLNHLARHVLSVGGGKTKDTQARDESDAGPSTAPVETPSAPRKRKSSALGTVSDASESLKRRRRRRQKVASELRGNLELPQLPFDDSHK